MRQEATDTEARAHAEIAAARKSEALPPPLLDALSDVATHGAASAVAAIDAGLAIATAAAPRPAATAAQLAPDTSGPATLLIGGINARLGYTVSAAFLAELGFEPARQDGARRFYRGSGLPLIGRAIADHTLSATQLQTA